MGGRDIDQKFECKFCSAATCASSFRATDMMYGGTDEDFEYGVCENCGSMQLIDPPSDMARFYRNQHYSSWRGVPEYIKKRRSLLHRQLKALRTERAIFGRSVIGLLLTKAMGEPEFPYDWEWFREFKVGRSHKVLDFGCGTGDLLFYLQSNGFTRLVGVDKFAHALSSTSCIEFLQSLPLGAEGAFDFIMAHHSLEHVEHPYEQLTELARFVRPGGGVLIRVPLAGSFSALEYGQNWVQLDAPRHLVLPSEKGMRLLGERAGLRLVKVVYDSTGFQFAGSEQYRAGIPMYDPERTWFPLGSNPNSPYGLSEQAEMQQRATALNATGQGDQAAFFFRRPPAH